MSSKNKQTEILTKEKLINNEDSSERKFRTLTILSYFVVLVLLGFPIWWYTTRVYRATLPLDEIYHLELKSRRFGDFGIPLSLEYDVLISFVHPDPESLDIKVDVHLVDDYLSNFLKKLLPIADFMVKSQWLYLTELGAIPRKHMDHYALSVNQLPHVITPLETKLWSHVSPRPSLNLVVYFPHCRSPLYIYNSEEKMSSTNTFVSPRWGGIYLMNADKESCELGHFSPSAKTMAKIFQQILLELFKVDNNITDNAIQTLKEKKIEEMLETSKKTLKSLAQLLSEINSIVISDKVADKIEVALRSIQEAEKYLLYDSYDDALIKAKIAFKNSEEAFGDPSLLALLYFPEDQKYAVYIPLYLPVMIPVVMSLTHFKKKFFKEKLE